METLNSTSGFTSEASLSGNVPHTPPYTPHRTKRPLERNDSPASARSIHPAETSSPAKRAPKRCIKDDVTVEELTEGDAGYITDIDVVYPHELEEVESDSGDDSDGSDGDESDNGITGRLSRLDCEDSPEGQFEKKRREKHLRKRKDSRLFKRSHSQTVKSDTEAVDPYAMADHDLYGSARRLRRRVRGPLDVKAVSENTQRSSPEHRGLAPAAQIQERQRVRCDSESSAQELASGEAMDVDDER